MFIYWPHTWYTCAVIEVEMVTTSTHTAVRTNRIYTLVLAAMQLAVITLIDVYKRICEVIYYIIYSIPDSNVLLIWSGKVILRLTLQIERMSTKWLLSILGGARILGYCNTIYTFFTRYGIYTQTLIISLIPHHTVNGVSNIYQVVVCVRVFDLTKTSPSIRLKSETMDTAALPWVNCFCAVVMATTISYATGCT